MKRLLCIMNSMAAGGAETFLMKVYRAIDRSKYQFDFCVTVEEPAFYDSEIKKLGGKIFHITQKTKNLKQFRKDLYSVVKDNHYDYVMKISANCMGFMDLKIAKKAGAKVCVARSSNSDSGNSFTNKAMHKLGSILYERFVDVKIAPSDLAAIYTFGKNAYQHNDVIILNNAIDLSVYQYSITERDRIRKELSIPENAVLIGHIGRFSAQKNHSFLIRIFSEIYKQKKDVRFLIVGKGELREDILNQINSCGIQHVTIVSDVRKDIPAILSALDVFVMPSLYEGMPNTIIEAQATGLPCILADTITKSANITGLVQYHSLEDKPDVWARTVLKLANVERRNTERDLKQHGYDIQDAVNVFVQAVFRSDN